MLCADIRNKLDRYISGELAPAVRAEIDLHLQSCGKCRDALRKLTRLSDLLKSAGTPRIPKGFADRVTAQADNRKTNKAGEVSFNPLHWWRKATVPMRAAAVLFLVIGLWAGFSMSRSVFSASAAVEDRQSSLQTNPVEQYNVDYLSGAPAGSLAGSYFDLISGSQRKE